MIRKLLAAVGRLFSRADAAEKQRSATIHQIAQSIHLRFGPPVFNRGGLWLSPLRSAEIHADSLALARGELLRHWDPAWGSRDQDETVGIKIFDLILEWRLISSDALVEAHFRRHLYRKRGSSGDA